MIGTSKLQQPHRISVVLNLDLNLNSPSTKLTGNTQHTQSRTTRSHPRCICTIIHSVHSYSFHPPAIRRRSARLFAHGRVLRPITSSDPQSPPRSTPLQRDRPLFSQISEALEHLLSSIPRYIFAATDISINPNFTAQLARVIIKLSGYRRRARLLSPEPAYSPPDDD